MLGWSDSAVSNYALLSKIDKRAWEIISTTFESANKIASEDTVGEDSTPVGIPPFTEGLLRSILHLNPEQQLELVQELGTNKDFSKGKFSVMFLCCVSLSSMKALPTRKRGRFRLS
jgi:hypothetical protein